MSRKIEVFTAGCGVCSDVVDLVRSIACSSCDVEVLDMQDRAVNDRAKTMGIHSVPAVVIDGKIAERSANGGYDGSVLRRAGVGVAM